MVAHHEPAEFTGGHSRSGGRTDGLRSEVLFAAYAQGEETENESWVLDFTEWASVYRSWLARQAEYRNEIGRLQAKRPGLAGLVRVAA